MSQNQDLRELAFALLDDDEGISDEAFIILSDVLSRSGNRDIVDHIKATEGRFYLRMEDAEELKKHEAIEE